MAWKFTLSKAGKKSCLLLPVLFLFSPLFAQHIFQPADAPAMPLINDGQPIETGVKFRSSKNGFIKGIRYYKGAGSTGTRIGQLWTNTGTLVASAFFTNETASGWQQVLFDSPVAINANVTYVAACHSSSGDYAVTNAYFTQPVSNGPLRALADGEEGPNGVYIFSQIPMLPTSGFNANNYWVDVVFEENTNPDTDPPTVSSVSPASAATGVSLTASIKAVFSEVMDASTITGASTELRNSLTNELIPSAVSYDPSSNTVTIDPSVTFTHSTSYTVRIKNTVKDAAGNPLTADYTWRFISEDLPFLPPGEAYGGPILVLSHAGNPFSRYTAELLRAEGLMEFDIRDISSVTATDLSRFDVVILGDMDVTAAQVTLLSNWTNAGGTLIVFRPRAALSSLLGLSAPGGTISNKYLLVNTSTAPGAGIVSESMQFHGDASLHTLNGAKSIALLCNDASTATAHPAVTLVNVGSNGGKAAAFTYDLARSVAYTRQGNPAWAGQERDGQAPIRSDDLFFGTPANTSADWVDFSKIAIPQADEQQRLLANIIIQSNLHRKPLPRLWYLPKALKAAVVMTGDDHANNGTTGRFNQYMTLGPNSPEDVANWNAVRATSYMYPGTPVSNAQAAALEAQGFELALHPTTNCTNYTESSLENAFSTQLAQFAGVFPGVSAPVTNRTHCLVWSDWATQAKVQARHGIRLDVNYYYWPASWVQNRPGLFTGSGLPMRFADTDGTLIDCYQVTTQMTDESGIHVGSFCDQLLDKATGPEGFYGTFCANMHTDTADHAGSNAVIASAAARKIPVISSRQLLTWLDGRNNTRFDSIAWNDHTLSFILYAPSGARNLYGMLPRFANNAQLVSVKRDGVSVWSHAETIKGTEYVFFFTSVGSHRYMAVYNSGTVVTIHPVSQVVCAGATVSFTSAASGQPMPAVQWQKSSDGLNWININGANNATLTFAATAGDNNLHFRAAWTNSNGTVYSNNAVLTVKPVPALSSTLSPPAVNSGAVFNYVPAGTVPGTAFSWTRASVPGINNPPAAGTGHINEVLVNTTDASIPVSYVFTLTANGCMNTQTVTVKVEPAGCSFSTSISANFNGISISSGRYIWFNSVFNPGNTGNSPVNVYITNGRITYTVSNQTVTLNVPDAHIRLASTTSNASVKFTDGRWETEIPVGYNGNIFLAGLSYRLTQNLPGGIRNVVWSADVRADRADITFDWKWTAGVYTNFAGHAGLNVKPVDGLLNILNPLLGIGNAGTPLNYTLNVVAGAMGSGLINITSTYSATRSETCNAASGMITGAPPSMPVRAAVLSEEQAGVSLNVNVSPNPVSDYFRIRVSGGHAKPFTLRIRDLSGRVVAQFERTGAGTLQAGHGWTAGTYFAEVVQDGERRVVKLVKIN